MVEIKTAYLAGGITGLDDKGQTWRQRAIALTPPGWKFINPYLYENENKLPLSIINDDLSLILSSHAVIANVDQPSWGTSIEIYEATHHQIPVIAFGRLKRPISIWLLNNIDHLYDTLEQAIEGVKLHHV